MTTPDPATLREALTWFEDLSRAVDEDLDRGDDLESKLLVGDPRQIEPVVTAARWALDLIEGGKEVWWCVQHDKLVCTFDDLPPHCAAWHKQDQLKCDCNMVKRLLVTP